VLSTYFILIWLWIKNNQLFQSQRKNLNTSPYWGSSFQAIELSFWYRHLVFSLILDIALSSRKLFLKIIWMLSTFQELKTWEQICSALSSFHPFFLSYSTMEYHLFIVCFWDYFLTNNDFLFLLCERKFFDVLERQFQLLFRKLITPIFSFSLWVLVCSGPWALCCWVVVLEFKYKLSFSVVYFGCNSCGRFEPFNPLT